MKKKLFVIRKYVYASDVIEALKKEQEQLADEVWVSEEYVKAHPWMEQKKDQVGFRKK